MRRCLLARLLGFALALTAGFATPASALAHGHAHEHEAEANLAAEHADSHHTFTVGSSDLDAGDHPHSSVDAALTTKGTTLLVIVAAAHVVLPVARVVVVAAPLPERTPQFRVEAAHAPPPRLRAPPTLLG